tara:strand:+ start:110 stop:274 length:165 start_codon:yes stop_codon:yes gene_type:complete
MFDDDLYRFAKAAAAAEGTDISGYIREAIVALREKKVNEYKIWHSVFDEQINEI